MLAVSLHIASLNFPLARSPFNPPILVSPSISSRLYILFPHDTVFYFPMTVYFVSST